MNETTTTTTAVENTLNSMMRGELAASDAYRQALTKVSDEAAVRALRQILSHHVEATAFLQGVLTNLGVVPAHSAGIWGKFTGAIQGAARLLGDRPTLLALREGESIGLRNYQAATADTDLPAEIRNHLQETLVPRASRHIEVLNHMLENTGSGADQTRDQI